MNKQISPPGSKLRNLFGFCAILTLSLSCVEAVPLTFSTTESGQYLLVATKRVGPSANSRGQEIDTNNFELGANKAPVPANTSFLNSGGGPTLEGNVPLIPANAAPVFSGIGGHGNIAITDLKGEIGLSDVGVYADPNIGIRLAAPNDSYNKSQNSFFNDPNDFPNTYDPITGTGVDVNPNDANQTTRIDPSGSGHQSANVGVTFGYNHTPLNDELTAARLAINALAATGVLNTSAGGGTLTGENGKKTTLTGGGISFSSPNSKGGYDITLSLATGLNVFDIFTGGNDFKLDGANLVIDGPSDAFAIFRLQGVTNMQMSNSNILSGISGIGMNNVLFYTNQTENDTHFDFNNAIINGVAFWSLGTSGGVININNSQGCTQLIADIISLDDVRFNRCAFGEGEQQEVPDTGGTLGFAALGLVGLGALRRLLGDARRQEGSC